MLLGGQHFAAALYAMRKKLIANCAEEDLPPAYRWVNSLVLKPNAPWAACRSAAGVHQSIQHDTLETSTADVCQMLLELLMDKNRTTGSPWLTDAELYAALGCCGVVRGSSEAVTKTKNKMVTADEAQQYAMKQVCVRILNVLVLGV